MQTDIRVTKDVARAASLLLDETYPQAHCELNFSNAFELLVATVLSAQTTDKRVNEVTPELFRRWGSPEKMAAAQADQLEAVLKPLGMFRRRTSQLKNLSDQIVSQMGGQVPGNRDLLMELPGVGRKTANVVLGNWFGQEEITVDTHVARVTGRLGWVNAKTPLRIEEQLWEILPDAPWTKLCHQLIFHGRRVCHARKPDCAQCPLRSLCPAAGNNQGDLVAG